MQKLKIVCYVSKFKKMQKQLKIWNIQIIPKFYRFFKYGLRNVNLYSIIKLE